MKDITARQRLYANKLLECIAKKQKTIFYSDLSELDGKPAQSVGKVIGELSKHCHSLGLPPISGMVINRKSLLPDCEGFGDLCKELGLYQEYKDYELLVEQCQKDIQECDRWHEFASYLNLKVKGISKVPDPIAMHEQSESIEGARIQITATVYERDPANRAKCLQKYGPICQICGFDASKVYGTEFKNLIHVHHKEPLGLVGKAHTIDPENDLIPVCPNCHMILHAKKDGVYKPEEVAEMIKRNKENI